MLSNIQNRADLITFFVIYMSSFLKHITVYLVVYAEHVHFDSFLENGRE